MLDRKKGAASLYAQIEAILKEQIENGEFSYGDMFPSEKQLQERFQVSRMTVRQAISELSNSGYLECARGIGTIVRYRKINETMSHVISFSEEMLQHGVRMSTTECSMELVAAKKSVAAALGILEGDMVYQLTRVRCADDAPMVYSITFLNPLKEFPLEADVYRESLYKYLREVHDIHICHATDTLEALLATAEISEKLHIAKDSALFRRSRCALNEQEIPVEYSVCYYPGNKYKYSVRI